MISVYIASPYTKPEGKQEENTQASFKVASELIEKGFAPYCPLWMHYMKECQPNYEECMSLDLFWAAKCGVLLRLPGESLGADREVEFAKKNGMPIFYSIEELIRNCEEVEM